MERILSKFGLQCPDVQWGILDRFFGANIGTAVAVVVVLTNTEVQQVQFFCFNQSVESIQLKFKKRNLVP